MGMDQASFISLFFVFAKINVLNPGQALWLKVKKDSRKKHKVVVGSNPGSSKVVNSSLSNWNYQHLYNH